MKYQTHSSERFYRSLSAMLILFAFYTAAFPPESFGNAAPIVKRGGNQDDFDKKFREGRDLIDREEWSRAAEKFGEAVEKYPDAKSADAALYWLAFCHKKQNQFEKADGALDRLLEKFPASSWAADARVMKMEISATTAPFGAVKNPPSAISPAMATKGTATTAPCPYESLISSGGCPNAAKTPLDREDEIKIAAFRSLLVADPRRAIETMGGILKPDSKASEILKLEVLRVSRSPRLQKTDSMIFAVGGAVAKEFAPLLRETLVKSFENEKNVKIRREIIYALASQMDDESTGYLKKLYAETDDREIKRAVVNSFTPPSSSFYAFETNDAAHRKTESNLLWEIVRAEKDSELRRLALANLQRFPKWADEQTLEILSRLYDSETDEPFKISVIRAIAAANRTGTGRKLLDIARNDRSDKLRLEAIFFLRGSKNPDIIKFLEDLIK